jgi:hypothetical protein
LKLKRCLQRGLAVMEFSEPCLKNSITEKS